MSEKPPRVHHWPPVPGAIRTLLVANRGEIAVRIIRSARERGIRTVALCSDVDVDTPWVRSADLAVRLEGSAPADTYLRVDRVVDGARRVGADAVHPGYGFLAERPDAARAVLEAGIAWVGPGPEAIEAMGDKIRAKEIARSAGVPVLPSVVIDAPRDGGSGEAGDDLPAWARTVIAEVGLPLLVKAAAGGGGRGMRVVREGSELAGAVLSAGREAESAFGDPTVFAERLVEGGRHVEVQVLADAAGQVVALGERDCSIQRRHQKVVEEAPAPGLDEDQRSALAVSAVCLAEAVGYVNAGTVEFLVEPDGRHWFLEMNTRLQVEHPVTEQVYGIDLVAAQLAVAAGGGLPADVLAAVDRGPVGHAVEVRLCAEDPLAGWMPGTGRIHRFRRPDLAGVRVDAGCAEGGTIGADYDSLVAKIVAHGPTREAAWALAARAVRGTVLNGPAHNGDLLAGILAHPDPVAAAVDVGWLERQDIAALCVGEDREGREQRAAEAATAWDREASVAAGAWAHAPAGWRNIPGAIPAVEFTVRGSDRLRSVTAPGVAGRSVEGDRVVVESEGILYHLDVQWTGDGVFVTDPEGTIALTPVPRFAEADGGASPGSLVAPMPGTVVRVPVGVGDAVVAGQVVAVLEAMKMEHAIVAAVHGVVAEVSVRPGDQVDAGRSLVRVDAPAPD